MSQQYLAVLPHDLQPEGGLSSWTLARALLGLGLSKTLEERVSTDLHPPLSLQCVIRAILGWQFKGKQLWIGLYLHCAIMFLAHVINTTNRT